MQRSILKDSSGALWIYSFITDFMKDSNDWIKKFHIKDEHNNLLSTNFEIAAIFCQT